MTISCLDLVANSNLVYVINPMTFISHFKSDFILAFKEMLDMEESDHFTIGLKVETKHTKRVLMSNNR